MRLKEEIAQQPQVLARLINAGAESTQEAAAAIRDFDPAFVCVAARGTSDHAALYAQYLFGAVLRLPVMLAAPSLHTVYGRPPDLSRALTIGVSQSGKAADARAVLDDARRQCALTLAITNHADSPLAQAADYHLPLLAGEERSVAATKTYTAQLTVIALLTRALAADRAMRDDLNMLPRLAEETLDLCGPISDWADQYRDMERVTALGRGYNYATACEISLKIKELTYIASEGYSEADFRHGPIAVVGPGYPLILAAPRGRTFAGMRDIFAVLKDKGAQTLVISDDDALLSEAAMGMPIPEVPEWLSPIISVMPGQVFAMHQAQVRGLNVDAPRGLSKVTITL